MDPIVGLFPRRFLWKLNQTEAVRARKQSRPEKEISSWDFLLRVDSIDIFRYSLELQSNFNHSSSIVHAKKKWKNALLFKLHLIKVPSKINIGLERCIFFPK